MTVRVLGIVLAFGMVGSGPLAQALHYCAAMEEVRLTPCCCAEAASRDVGPCLGRPAHGPGCCKQVVSPDVSRATREPSGVRPEAPQLGTLAPAASRLPLLRRVGVDARRESRGPPRALGPPIYLRVRSLLI